MGPSQWVGADVLDVGCGTGWFLELLKKNGACWGTIAEIVRKTRVYIKAAEKTKFSFIEEISMLPTKALISSLPKYAKYRNEAITYLLRFKKS